MTDTTHPDPSAAAVATVLANDATDRAAHPLVDGATQAAAADPYEKRPGRAAQWQKVAAAVSGS